ncbi:peptidase M61 [Olivibacter sitiensis]|uniref:M61 family metallopeptidase n=1 Tax=Olivibacter sitiensis TaxID=376470 RepID=UPI00040F210F|nr:peptidase M61 [Olivibacter sitiensis]
MNKNIVLFFILSIGSFSALLAQGYSYSVNLNDIQNDQLSVTLITPEQENKNVVFSLPKIIPGTYAISDYGAFISDVTAYDKKGKQLPVNQLNVNQWEISKAKKLHKIVYQVEDIFDTEKEHEIYPMAATNIEKNNIVIHSPGIFGYLDHLSQVPFEITFDKPSNFYASSSRLPVSSTASQDVFEMDNLDDLYDTPIMYGIADTASVKVGNCDVLVSVYSPNQLINAKEIVGWLTDLLQGARSYLGGKLPADRYAFLYYFNDPKVKQSFQPGMAGALEHTTSSFYYLPELPAQQLKPFVVDVASHEFFHIITPLTIASKEVKEFNYNEPVLSKHLWLYEGSTEYTAHHVQVKSGINTKEEFLAKLSQKIADSKASYNDTLSFTQLSKYAASTYAEQYGNVYQKGALIAACLDIYLLHLSDGGYGFKNLTHDLGIRFGKERYFNDDELFDEIEKLSYPEIKEFLLKYVDGTAPIPYDYFFGLAGVKYQDTDRSLHFDDTASAKALKIQQAWLGTECK